MDLTVSLAIVLVLVALNLLKRQSCGVNGIPGIHFAATICSLFHPDFDRSLPNFNFLDRTKVFIPPPWTFDFPGCGAMDQVHGMEEIIRSFGRHLTSLYLHGGHQEILKTSKKLSSMKWNALGTTQTPVSILPVSMC